MTTAYNKFFINGEWVEPDRPKLEVINPATEEPFATISLGTTKDVDAAAKAAKAALRSSADIITLPLLVTLIFGPVANASPQKHIAQLGSKVCAARKLRIDSAWLNAKAKTIP